MIFCIMVSFVQTTNLYNGIIRVIVETMYNAPIQIFINQTINSITCFHITILSKRMREER